MRRITTAICVCLLGLAPFFGVAESQGQNNDQTTSEQHEDIQQQVSDVQSINWPREELLNAQGNVLSEFNETHLFPSLSVVEGHALHVLVRLNQSIMFDLSVYAANGSILAANDPWGDVEGLTVYVAATDSVTIEVYDDVWAGEFYEFNITVWTTVEPRVALEAYVFCDVALEYPTDALTTGFDLAESTELFVGINTPGLRLDIIRAGLLVETLYYWDSFFLLLPGQYQLGIRLDEFVTDAVQLNAKFYFNIEPDIVISLTMLRSRSPSRRVGSSEDIGTSARRRTILASRRMITSISRG